MPNTPQTDQLLHELIALKVSGKTIRLQDLALLVNSDVERTMEMIETLRVNGDVSEATLIEVVEEFEEPAM